MKIRRIKIMSKTFFDKIEEGYIYTLHREYLPNDVYSSYVEQFHCNNQPFYAPCLNKKRKKK